jgi:hypothetical protein
MPRRSRARFRRLQQVVGDRPAARGRARRPRRPPGPGSPRPPGPGSPRTPPPPRPHSLEGLTLALSDWRVLADHLYRLQRRHNLRLAELLWQRAWEVDQGFRERLSAALLPTAVPAARPGLNARAVRRAYDALMHDIRRRKLPTLTDAEIVTRVEERLLTIGLGLEEAVLSPRLLAAVKQHTPRTATLAILAWALGKRVSYLTRLLARTPRRPLGL